MDILAFLTAALGLIFAILALARVSSLQVDVGNLRQQLNVLRTSAHGASADPIGGVAVSEAPIVPVQTSAPLAERPPARKPRPVSAEQEGLVKEAIARDGAWERAIAAPRTPSPLAVWLNSLAQSEEWETMVGGRWLNRIGALALILGVGFFLKYAFDQNWVSESVRVLIGVGIGAGLLSVAFQAHRKSYAIFAQGLVGAGTATLYLAVYASYNFYHLVPPVVALAGMGVVTAIAFVQALYYDSLAVALLGWIGGFLTPFLLTLQSPDEIGLFGYLYLLLIGILAILMSREEWAWLGLPSVMVTYGILVLWYERSYTSKHLALTAILLIGMWALIFAYDGVTTLRSTKPRDELGLAQGGLNAVLSYTLLFAVIEPRYQGWAAALAFALAAVNAVALAGMARARKLSHITITQYAVTAIALVVIGTFLATSGFWAVVALSTEATLLIAFGCRQRVIGVAESALGVYAIATVRLATVPHAFAYEPVRSFVVIANQRALAFAMLAASLAAGAIIVHRWADARMRRAFPMLVISSCTALFGLVTVETNDLFRHELAGATGLDHESLDYARYIALSAVWMALSIPLVWLGARRRLTSLAASGAGIFGVGAITALSLGLAFQPVQRFVVIANIRALLLILLVGLLVVSAHTAFRRKREYTWLESVGVGLGVTAMMTCFELVTVEINDSFRHLGTATAAHQGTQTGVFLETAILAVAWMMLSVPLVTFGLRRGMRPALKLGAVFTALGVAAALYAGLGWTATSQLGFTAIARTMSIAAVVAFLMSEARMLRTLGATERWTPTALIAVQAAVLILGFELITAESRDLFRHSIATSSASSAPSLRDLEQLMLSIVWLAYGIGLMLLGLWRRTRWIRLGSLALFGIVILKIFGYDLSFLAPAYRYISFAGLGVILLGVSFLYQRYRGLLLEAA